MGRLLGIDYGEKRIGLALGDMSSTVASPYCVVQGEDALWSRLEELVVEKEIEGFVVGLPRNMNGSLGPKAEEVLRFKTRLEARHALPVETWDERLTTVQAERSMRDGAVAPRKRRGLVDKIAAQILLQSYLDWRGRGS